jgi:hypothetical protein
LQKSGRRPYLIGNRIQYRINTPQTQSGNRYTFQFQGSGAFDLKHLVKESCIKYFTIKKFRCHKVKLDRIQPITGSLFSVGAN